jgi:chromosome segregation ATPase
MSRTEAPVKVETPVEKAKNLQVIWENRALEAEQGIRDLELQKASLQKELEASSHRGYSLEREVQRLQAECARWMKQALESPAFHIQRAENLYADLQMEQRASEKLKGVIALLLDLGAPKSETYPFEQNSPLDELVKEAGLGSLGK